MPLEENKGKRETVMVDGKPMEAMPPESAQAPQAFIEDFATIRKNIRDMSVRDIGRNYRELYMTSRKSSPTVRNLVHQEFAGTIAPIVELLKSTNEVDPEEMWLLLKERKSGLKAISQLKRIVDIENGEFEADGGTADLKFLDEIREMLTNAKNPGTGPLREFDGATIETSEQGDNNIPEDENTTIIPDFVDKSKKKGRGLSSESK